MAVARDPGNAHHLTGANLQRNGVKVDAKLVFTRKLEIGHTQHGRTGLARMVLQLRGLRANHQARKRGIRLLGRVAHPGDLAAAQYGTGGAEFTNFMELVADVQNTAAFRGQLFQHHKEFFNCLRRQHRGRLVQNQQLRVGQQGPDDLHPLHLAHAQGVHRAAGVNVQPVFRRLGRDAAGNLGQAQAFVQPQPHIFSHRDGVKQAEMLEHHADTQRTRLLRVANMHGFAVEQHGAFVGLDRAVDDFHQGRFAGAVFTQHRMGFTGQHGQGHLAIGHHARVGFGDAGQLEPGRWHVHECPVAGPDK